MKMKNTALFFSQDALMSSAWKFPEQYKSTEAPARETAHRMLPGSHQSYANTACTTVPVFYAIPNFKALCIFLNERES